jgi:hypothetical protein
LPLWHFAFIFACKGDLHINKVGDKLMEAMLHVLFLE